MDCLTSWQVVLARDWCRQSPLFRRSWVRPAQDEGTHTHIVNVQADAFRNGHNGGIQHDKFNLFRGNRSALAAVSAVAALNIPALVYFRGQHSIAVERANQGWEAAVYRMGAVLFSREGKNDTEPRIQAIWHSLIRPVLDKYVLNHASIRSGRWWMTCVTTNFLHLDYWHFYSNIGGLLWWGCLSAQIPGMNAAHVIGLTLSACVGTSLGSMLYEYLWWQQQSGGGVGASGIVYAFAAAVACGIAEEYVGTPNVTFRTHVLLKTSFDTMIVGEVYNVLAGGMTVNGKRISHCGHLGGAVAGAAYYYLVLRRRRKTRAQVRG